MCVCVCCADGDGQTVMTVMFDDNDDDEKERGGILVSVVVLQNHSLGMRQFAEMRGWRILVPHLRQPYTRGTFNKEISLMC